MNQPSIADTIRANSEARANGWDGAAFVDGQFRPYKTREVEVEVDIECMSDRDLDDYLRDEYPEWHL